MAKTYKKKQDKFVRNIFIGFGVVFFLMFSIFLYMKITEPSYSDFTQVGDYADIENMLEDTYAVYFYSETCPACNSIKSGFLKFAEENDLELKVYLLDLATTSGDRLAENPALTSTPTLMIIQDGQIVDFIVSSDSIQTFMGEVADGTYDVLD